MVDRIFNIFSTMMKGAGTMMAGGALLTSTALLSAKKLDNDEKQITEYEKDNDRKRRNISGKYKIVDTENNLAILTSTDDLTEARAWLCEYRTCGYRVLLKTK